MENFTNTLDITDSLDIRDYAFFFDIDGTLTEIRARPDEVTLQKEVKLALQLLCENGQALALISGRTFPEIDKLTSPLMLPGAAIHGALIRHHEGRMESTSSQNHSVISQVREYLKIAITDYPDLYVENKDIAFALHYRKVPALAEVAKRIATEIVNSYPDYFLVQQGKCVCELNPCNVSKGLAVKKIMDTAIFRNKIPIYVGDDVTDESAFLEVNRMKGLSIKVGEGPTTALHRFSGVEETIKWLITLADKFNNHSYG